MSFDRRASLSLAIHEAMIASVAPSAFLPRPDGIGYCSAVSTRLTPASVATSSIAWHILLVRRVEIRAAPALRAQPQLAHHDVATAKRPRAHAACLALLLHGGEAGPPAHARAGRRVEGGG